MNAKDINNPQKEWIQELRKKGTQYEDVIALFNDMKALYATDSSAFRAIDTSAPFALKELSIARNLSTEAFANNNTLPGLIISTKMFNFAEALKHNQVKCYLSNLVERKCPILM
jgi:hypothetical protein